MKRLMKQFISFLLVLFYVIQIGYSQDLSRDERMRWWREARFGLFTADSIRVRAWVFELSIG